MNNLAYLQTVKIGSSENMTQTQMEMTYRAPVRHAHTDITEQGNGNDTIRWINNEP